MKEIKFRVYNKREKILINHSGSRLFPPGFLISRLYDYSEDDLLLLQYTGLKDKNGREIYEGDIVKETFSNCEEGFIGIVTFGEHDTNSNDLEASRAYGYYLDSGKDSLGFNQWNMTGEDLEIIGNIYENPELLENSK